MQLLGILFSVSLLFLQSNLDKIPTEDPKKIWKHLAGASMIIL